MVLDTLANEAEFVSWFPVLVRRCMRCGALRQLLGPPERVEGLGICTWMLMLCAVQSELPTHIIRQVNTLHGVLAYWCHCHENGNRRTALFILLDPS